VLNDKESGSLTGETVMTLYIGLDFHPHQQTLVTSISRRGMATLDWEHNLLKVKEFYASLAEPAVIGIEAILQD
jgi:hypothetical protein